jgi:hypothetical protein
MNTSVIHNIVLEPRLWFKFFFSSLAATATIICFGASSTVVVFSVAFIAIRMKDTNKSVKKSTNHSRESLIDG